MGRVANHCWYTSAHFSLPTAVAAAMERLFGWLTGNRLEEEEREKDTSSISSRERGQYILLQDHECSVAIYTLCIITG